MIKGKGRPEKPFSWNGHVYENVRVASDKLKISVSNLYRLRREGKGEAFSVMKVMVNGTLYDSQSSAARALGVPVEFIHNCLKIGILSSRDHDLA